MGSDHEEEEFYSEEELGFGSDDDDDDVSQPSDGNDDDEEPSFIEEIEEEIKEENYKVLSEGDVQRSQEQEIMEVCSVLSVSQDSASILLRHSNWRANSVHEHWFSDEENFRKAVGLLEKPVLFYPDSEEVICGICFDTFPRSEMHSAGCGHLFCSFCWKGYISTAIHDGPGCLTLRCPDPGCIAAIDQSMVNKLVSDEDNEKYSYYLVRSYVEASKSTKWCPAPGCDYAVKFELGSENYDVSCKCSNKFCWNCIEDAHRPVDCSTVAKWMLKNSSEAENTEWLIANCKPCPKCKRSIEKNHGCMHMTCTPPCNYQFCWLCLGVWSEHGTQTGGFYACNSYAKEKQEGLHEETEKRREMAKNSVEKYTHYYERWAANQSSRQKAMADLQKLQTVDIKKLSNIQGDTSLQLKFITEAWEQIIECRRVLKWTYAYGYYLPEEEHEKTQLFEYLQGQAESGLECLHQCTEKALQKYLDATKPPEDFNEFRIRLTGLTKTARVFFQNLVHALEKGLTV